MPELVFEFTVRAALIAGIAAAVLRALQVKTAAARHAVWVGVMVVMLASSHVVSLGTEGISARATKDAASPHRHRSADARQSYPATNGRSLSAR